MSDHWTPKDFFEFIDKGGGSGPAGHHLISIRETSAALSPAEVAAGSSKSPENFSRASFNVKA